MGMEEGCPVPNNDIPRLNRDDITNGGELRRIRWASNPNLGEHIGLNRGAWDPSDIGMVPAVEGHGEDGRVVVLPCPPLPGIIHASSIPREGTGAGCRPLGMIKPFALGEAGREV